MSALPPQEGAPAPNRQDLLDAVHGTLDLFEFQQPYDVLSGCATDHNDPLVLVSDAPSWVKSGLPHLIHHDANGHQIPLGYDLREIVERPGRRPIPEGAWQIDFAGADELETDWLRNKLPVSVRAQVRVTNPAKDTENSPFGISEYPEGMFFFPRQGEAAPAPGQRVLENPLDALFFPYPPFNNTLLRGALHFDPRNGAITPEQVADFRAPAAALKLLAHGLQNYIEQFPVARRLWARIQENQRD